MMAFHDLMTSMRCVSLSDPFQLEDVPSMAFALKIVDDIDPNHVNYAWIHSEVIHHYVPSMTLFLLRFMSLMNSTDLLRSTFRNHEAVLWIERQ